MSVLAANMLSKQLGQKTVLHGVTMQVAPGELVLLAGRNGAGKSTLLRCLIGAIEPDAGSVQLDGKPILSWQPKARAREVAFVPQDTEVPFEFTGRELVTMGRHPHRGRSETLRAEDVAAVARALQLLDAEAFSERSVITLSGGEQRRIAVARALATEARLLLLDEPTNNLDLEHALQLVVLLRRLADEGHGVLVASHDLNLFAPHCDRVVLLHNGRADVDQAPEEALSRQNVERVFGVRSHQPTKFFPREFRL